MAKVKITLQGYFALIGWWAAAEAGLLGVVIGRDSMWVDNHWVDHGSRFQLLGATPQEVQTLSLYPEHRTRWSQSPL